MTYFIADTHFGHANIIRLCNRSFADVGEMDKTMADAWNYRVTDRDDIWILGDFAFGKCGYAEGLLKQLNGHKHLVTGNHDHRWMKDMDLSRYFESVNEIAQIKLDDKIIVMCHYPMMTWNRSHYGAYLVFGHIHDDTRMSFWPMIKDNDHMLNAGVDVNHFMPVTFEEMIANNADFKSVH